MPGWTVGLLAGLLAGLAVAGAGGWLLYLRLCALQTRTRQVERLAELGTLTGGLAHEIKNPLSTVQLNLQLLQEDLGDSTGVSPRARSRLATIQREALRLRETLDDFLRYAGRIELQPEPLELNKMLGELVDFLAPQAQLAKVQLRHDQPAEKVIARADPKLIKQAALNLMLNAMQAMPDGGDLIVAARRRDGDVEMSVTDTGAGITPEDQAKIFEAYFSKRKGGMGLGLAMTKRIAEEHGGHIELTSQPGKGSSFRLILPASA